MPTVQVKEVESLDNALRRFRRLCDRAGIVTESRRRRYRETPGEMKKRKRVALHLQARGRFRGERKKSVDIAKLLRCANVKIEPKPAADK